MGCALRAGPACLVVLALAGRSGSAQGFVDRPDAASSRATVDGQQMRAYCSLSGRVMAEDKTPLPDAEILLRGEGDAAYRATTGADGSFRLGDLPPGSFTVTVSRDGFAALSGVVRLAADANTGSAVFTLRPSSSSSVTVQASEKEIAEAQLELQEQQRLAGIVPNFFVSYVWHATPLTSGQKFRLAFKNASDPGNLLLVGTVAGVQQATNSFSGYGQGWKGYGRRYGADLGNLVAGTFMGSAVLPSLFHQDPRYFYKGSGSVRSRFWYAVGRTVVIRGDNGRPQPNVSTVLGDLSAGAISNLYYAPEDRRGATLTIANGLLGVAGDAMNNVFQEFVFKKLTTNSKRNTLADQR